MQNQNKKLSFVFDDSLFFIYLFIYLLHNSGETIFYKKKERQKSSFKKKQIVSSVLIHFLSHFLFISFTHNKEAGFFLFFFIFSFKKEIVKYSNIKNRHKRQQKQKEKKRKERKAKREREREREKRKHRIHQKKKTNLFYLSLLRCRSAHSCHH